MRQPPQLSVKTWGGGGGLRGQFGGGRLKRGGGQLEDGGGGSAAGGGSQGGGGGGLCGPTTTTCIPPGGMCVPGVWGYGGMYVIIALSCLCREQSLKGRRWPLAGGATAPDDYLSKPGGGGGGCQTSTDLRVGALGKA